MLSSLENVKIIGNFESDQLGNMEHYQLISELEYHRRNLKATQFYFTYLKRKAIKSLHLIGGKYQQQNILRKMFDFWELGVRMSKLEKYLEQKRVFRKLQENRMKKLQKNIKVVQGMTAQNCYERCLKAKVFCQWKQTIKIIKKQQIVIKMIKANALSQLLGQCQNQRSNKFTRKLVEDLRKQKKLQLCFAGWVLYTKQSQVIKRISKSKLSYFTEKLKKYCSYEKQTYQNFYNKRLIKKAFIMFNLNCQNQKYTRYRNKKVLRYFFDVWIKAGNILYYQKEEQIKNQQVVQEYKNRKAKIVMLYCFQKWKNMIEAKREQRRKNQIAKQYGQVKEKHIWLKKCFQEWKMLKKINKADKFNQFVLKTRVINILKDQVIKASQKWERLYKFVQKRQKTKYFVAIRNFIENDRAKVHHHLIEKAWNKFTFAITKSFVDNLRRAESYHNQSLKFKTIFGLKKIVNITAKIQTTFIFINVNMNLKRWYKSYRVRQFVQAKEYLLKGNIFRSLKLLRMGKIWSERQSISPGTQRKRQNYLGSQSKTESWPSQERIALDSPSKVFSLEYSISAYNSNNIFQNI